MPVEIDNPVHCEAFVRLNEQWVEEHFALEESDRELAADPYGIVRNGGLEGNEHPVSVAGPGRVLGGDQPRLAAIFGSGGVASMRRKTSSG